jgi:hypothetical protein
MFNLHRIKPLKYEFIQKYKINKLNSFSEFNKLNYLPKDIESKMKNKNMFLIKNKPSEFIVFFSMILGIVFGSFIYYINL